jgi:hypothetical protein
VLVAIAALLFQLQDLSAGSMANSYDDEMMSLAAEMSLMEDAELDFDPHKLEDTREKIKDLEKLVDEHLIADQLESSPRVLDSQPISSAQIREIFAVTGVQMPSKGSTPQPGTSYNDRDSESLFSALSEGVPALSLREPTTTPAKVKRPIQKDTIASVTWKLKWYQKKLVHQIEQTHEVR